MHTNTQGKGVTMTMNTPAPYEHWRDRAIAAAETISDGFDVAKAYGAHIANWVLFFCLVANLIEMVSPAFRSWAGMVIVGIQSITLDVAGFGLTAMAASARRRGDTKSARKADIMGWTLISVMAVTVSLITLAAFDTNLAEFVNEADNALMLIRVIVTVFYGHIVHQLREASTAHETRLAELETLVPQLQQQLTTQEQEIATVQGQLAGAQKHVADIQRQLEDEKENGASIRHKLDVAQQHVSSLEAELEAGHGDTAGLRRELNAAHAEVESLRGRLDAKQRELDVMAADQAGIIALRRDLNTARVRAEELHMELEARQQALKNEQALVASLRREVERFQQSGTQQHVSSQHGTAQSGTHLVPPIVPLPQRHRQGGMTRVERETGSQSAVESGESLSARGRIYRLLDENNTRQVADLMRMTNLPKTTVWRHWSRYHEEHGTSDLARLASGDIGQPAESETA